MIKEVVSNNVTAHFPQNLTIPSLNQNIFLNTRLHFLGVRSNMVALVRRLIQYPRLQASGVGTEYGIDRVN